MARSNPLGVYLIHPCLSSVSKTTKTNIFKYFTLLLTFLAYTSYHLSRKPISVVKTVLHHNCSHDGIIDNGTKCDWAPFDEDNYTALLGSLDYGYLFCYAIGMFFSGHIAERVNLRYFLACGMILSGWFTAMFGLGYTWNIHHFWYYIVVQVFGGFVQSTGWPSVVAATANWFGKGKRGLILGIWNAHTSVGNILGSVIPGFFVDYDWGLAFIVPGVIIASVGVLIFFFLVPNPEDIGCDPPDHIGHSAFAPTHSAANFDTREAEHDDAASAHVQKATETPTRDTMDFTDSGAESDESTPLVASSRRTGAGEEQAISILRAVFIPGVIEFSICLFFAKLVSYTFLYWLPKYINNATSYDAEKSGDLSTLFDFGGILGGIVAGVASDYLDARALVCVVMLVFAAPMMYIYRLYGAVSYATNCGLLFVTGFFVNGPYALITTAVSADLGTHSSLHGNSKALATVTAIIDGTGSMGAALGPLLTGLISPTGWNNVFYLLIASDIVALACLGRLTYKEVTRLWSNRRAATEPAV